MADKKNKGGRKARSSDGSRGVVFSISMSVEEKENLDKLASALDMSRTELVRHALKSFKASFKA